MRLLLIVATICLMAFSPSNKQSLKHKSDAIKLYQEEYETSYLTSFKWKGCKLFCNPGKIQNNHLKAAENRINYFRKIVGLQSISLDSSLNSKAQHVAFLMLRNSKISHHPNEKWKCFNDISNDAAQNSNLRFYDNFDFSNKGKTINPITGFIEDYGMKNNALGHRRWILYSQLKNVGYGTTNKTEAIYISHEKKRVDKKNLPEFIAYPPKGYITKDILFSKWSFSIPDLYLCDFSKTTISVKDGKNKTIKIKKFKPNNLYGDPTIVWEVSGLFKKNNNKYIFSDKYLNKTLTVNVKNVIVDNVSKNFEYNVTIIQVP